MFVQGCCPQQCSGLISYTKINECIKQVNNLTCLSIVQHSDGPNFHFFRSKGHSHWHRSYLLPKIEMCMILSLSAMILVTLVFSAFTSMYISFFFAFKFPLINIVVRSLILFPFSRWSIYESAFIIRKYAPSLTLPCWAIPYEALQWRLLPCKDYRKFSRLLSTLSLLLWFQNIRSFKNSSKRIHLKIIYWNKASE